MGEPFERPTTHISQDMANIEYVVAKLDERVKELEARAGLRARTGRGGYGDILPQKLLDR